VIFVKGALLLVAHALVVATTARDHHHHGVRQRAPGQHQEFQAVVEHGRVAAVLVDDRQHFFEVVAEQLDSNIFWRACIQLTLPRRVLISPLWIR
jgi:hypothetical protein